MGKKSWLVHSPLQVSRSACGVVKSTSCRLNRGMGCTCGRWGLSVVFSEEEKEIARNFDVKKAIEEAIQQRKEANLPV